MPRIMWLLNHRTARKFEIPMLKKIGITEIFLPKTYPHSVDLRSADIDYSEDKHLTIPHDELIILNETDWYDEVPTKVWEIANRYFDVLFFIALNPVSFKNVFNHFKGAIIWRVYGLDQFVSYTSIFKILTKGLLRIETLSQRFWLGQAYAHLHEIEAPYLQARKTFLPLGLHSCDLHDQWKGDDPRLYFICPDQGCNPYYNKVYETFCANFGDFPYVCGGAQALPVNDPNVLGFVPDKVHEENMRQFRVMFYHSTEPNHIHYHPFEAIRAGIPLVFMGGGLLDRMGAIGLPGRCTSIKEAREKIHRILNDDWELIDHIRQSQPRLLDPMRPENCEAAWKESFARIHRALEEYRAAQSIKPPRKKRIAVILPIGYRGGTLNGAKLLAKALLEGSCQLGQAAEIVLAYPEDSVCYIEDQFDDLTDSIAFRTFNWKELDASSAQRAMQYAGYVDWKPDAACYVVPDDGMRQFFDCNVWVIVSDRLSKPLMPMRPTILMVYDYLQRYVPAYRMNDQAFLNAAHAAERIMVTTHFTEQDAIQYAGMDSRKVHKVPMLIPEYEERPILSEETSYFIWTTNAAIHKNHHNAFKALKIYYEELDGLLECHVTGVNVNGLLKSEFAHLKPLADMMARSRMLRKRLRLLGELSANSYYKKLNSAAFLWHPCQIDNGTFSVVEAAYLNVPSLSSDYPAMQEINSQFKLSLTWMNSDNPKQMAQQLKWMEMHNEQQRALLPPRKVLAEQNVKRHARQYWEVVQACL